MADVFRLTSFNSSFSILATCNSLHRVLLSADKKAAAAAAAACAVVYPAAGGGGSRLPPIPRRLLPSFKVHATVAETEQPKWWEKNAGPNMIDIHSTQEFLSALSQAGDRLVIVEFYGTWCASCRALFPKLCRTAVEHPEILFLKVNFDENKPMCKSLNVKVLPYFHFYRGAHGQLESFSCSLAKFQKIKDAIEKHSNIGSNSSPTPTVVGGELTLESISTPTEQQTGSSKT